MNIKLDSQLASPIQVQTLLDQLENWLSHLQQSHIKQRLHLTTADAVSQSLLKDIRHLGIKSDLSSADEVSEIIASIKDCLKSAPVLHMTFSAPVDRQSQAAIVEWIHQQINPGALVEFIVDGSIAAGFVLRTTNHIFNFTANGMLWQSRGHIGELVRRG